MVGTSIWGFILRDFYEVHDNPLQTIKNNLSSVQKNIHSRKSFRDVQFYQSEAKFGCITCSMIFQLKLSQNQIVFMVGQRPKRGCQVGVLLNDPTLNPGLWVDNGVRIILLFMFCGSQQASLACKSSATLKKPGKFSQPSHLRD